MEHKYLKREKARARKIPRPVYRFGVNRYECPFCRFQAYAEHKVYDHIDNAHLEEDIPPEPERRNFRESPCDTLRD